MSFLVTDVVDRESDMWRTLYALPKVELHRHLEGAMRLETLFDIGHEYDIDAPLDHLESLRPLVQMTERDQSNLIVFLEKFGVLRNFYLNEPVLRRVVREAIEDAAADNIRYMELRFTPNSWARGKTFTLEDVVEWACDESIQAARENRIKVNLIVSMNRHEGLEVAKTSLQAALNFQHQNIVGLDLAGKEPGFPARPFGPVFRDAKKAGLGVTVHAGEWEGPENVRDAIESVKADRIGHGVRIVEDSSTALLARERGIYFEVCPTSNIQTGVVGLLNHHPVLDMRFLDLPITINTDDPTVHQNTLTDEYALAVEVLGMTLRDIHTLVINAAKAAFLPENQKHDLINSLRRELGTSKYRGLEK